MRKTIGLLGGAFKPFHFGHMLAVKSASEECDEVILFVSTGDRIKREEYPITWFKMEKIWNQFILKILPNNVYVRFVDNPLTAIFNFLDMAEKTNFDHNTYNVYASEEDLKSRFFLEKLKRYFPKLVEESRIETVKTARVGSGTKMRKALQDRNLEGFIEGLPTELQPAGLEIWKILL